MKQLEQQVGAGNQSWYYEALYEHKGIKVKVNIRRNAYDNQSHARVYCFDKDKLKWNIVASVPYALMKCRDIDYVEKNVTANRFAADEKTLLNKVKLLLE